MDKEWDSMPSVILAGLSATHAGVEDFVPCLGAVVGGKNEDRIVRQPFFLKKAAESADVVIDVGDHAEEVTDIDTVILFVRIREFLRGMHGPMRSVG